VILPPDMDDEAFVKLFGMGSTKPRAGKEMEAIRAANFLMNHDDGGGAWIKFNKDPDAARRAGAPAVGGGVGRGRQVNHAGLPRSPSHGGHDHAQTSRPAAKPPLGWIRSFRQRPSATAAWCVGPCVGWRRRWGATPSNRRCGGAVGTWSNATASSFVFCTPAPSAFCSRSKIRTNFRTLRFFVRKIDQADLSRSIMSNDPLVIFTPSGKRGHFPVGTPILTAARQLGVDLDSVCGGRGICSKCQVAPSYGDFPKHGVTVASDALSEWNAVEDRYNRVRGLAGWPPPRLPGHRAGRHRHRRPPESQVHRQVVRKAASARPITMDPATRVVLVEVQEPDMHEPSGDLERLKAALADQWGITGVTAPLHILQRLQPALRKGKWQVSVALHRPANTDTHEILGVWPGLHEGGLYGLAIDLGSTTIAAHLCDLTTVMCWPPPA
jgi:hypothetical protein